MYRSLAAILIALTLPMRADRVRVVVAVDAPRFSATSAGVLRAHVMDALRTARKTEPWGSGPAFAVEVDRSELELLRLDPRVRAISIDEGGEAALLESVPRIGADIAHAAGFDGRGVTVALLDTGIDAKNPDFAGRIVAQQCFCDNLDGTGCCPGGDTSQSGGNAAADDNGHGTHVAGIIASSGASGPQGVAPAANIVAVKVIDSANGFRSFTQIYRALEWIAGSRPDVRVINMSLGSRALFSTAACGSDAIALGMRDVIGTLRARGVLITASSGNQSSTTGTTLPACMSEVLAIGATYDASNAHASMCPEPRIEADQITCFTNSTDAIDLVAPGATIAASRRGGGSTVLAGTSMAAPHVAGTIALMQQKGRGRLTADQTEAILKFTGRQVVDPRNGLSFPRVDAAAAVAATPDPGPPPRRRSVRK